jgi:hypothetical protein
MCFSKSGNYPSQTARITLRTGYCHTNLTKSILWNVILFGTIKLDGRRRWRFHRVDARDGMMKGKLTSDLYSSMSSEARGKC